MDANRKRPLVALLLFAAGSCIMGRNSGSYMSFVASHDAIRPGMSIRQVFEGGLADYLIGSGGKSVPGGTVPEKQPVSTECRRHVVDVHYGPGNPSTGGGFSVSVYCNMNGPSDKQLVPPRLFSTKGDLLDGLDTYSSWLKSLTFRVESPPLQIGGVHDSYNFSIDHTGKVTTVSSILKAQN
jgi:hypothetical protein